LRTSPDHHLIASTADTLVESRALSSVETSPALAAELPNIEITTNTRDTSLPAFCTLLCLIPLWHNPAPDGSRVRVESDKLQQTEREIRQMFTGYSRSVIFGWYRDEATGEEFTDELIRYEIDARITAELLTVLKCWKRELEVRFQQRAIYFRFTRVVACW
jgi:hypothetical protein